jgi:hypothetical protein
VLANGFLYGILAAIRPLVGGERATNLQRAHDLALVQRGNYLFPRGSDHGVYGHRHSDLDILFAVIATPMLLIAALLAFLGRNTRQEEISVQTGRR